MVGAGWKRLSPASKVFFVFAAGYVAAPWPAVKLVLASAAVACAAAAPGFSLRPRLRLILGICFTAALLALPYWLFFRGVEPPPYWQFVWFAAVAAAGWAWVTSVDSLTGAPEPLPPIAWWKPALVAAILLLLNWSAFFQVVASRGDESTHILRLWAWLVALKSLLSTSAGLAAAALTLLWAGLRRADRRIAAACLGAAIGLWLCSVILVGSQIDLAWLPRYPGLQMWWQATALSYAPMKSLVAREGLYRIVPLLSVAFLAIYIMRGPLAHAPALTQLGTALVIATLPAVRYYSTLLYLDLPMIAAITIVCFESERLALAWRSGRMPAGVGWYGLVLSGFLKETAVLFVAIAFIFLVLAGQRNWVKLGWSLAGPLVVFLLSVGEQRAYSFRAANFFEISNYRILAGALWEQYGWVLLLAGAGALVLVRQKRWLLLGICLATTAVYTLFYLADGVITLDHGVWRPEYLGHARFMLCWLPAVAVFTVRAVEGFARPLAWSAIAVILAGNLWVYPVRADAAPNSHWGDYVYDTSDHFYPYDAVFEQGHTRFPRVRRLAVVGADFYYPYSFYQRRWNWPAEVDAGALPIGYSAEAFRAAVALAIIKRPDLLLIHVMDHLPPEVYEAAPSGYVRAGDFHSRFHRLLVFQRQRGG